MPIAFDGDSLYLDLFGTGFDAASGATGTTVIINGMPAAVTYSGAQGSYAGLDQIQAQLSGSLAGSGVATVTVTVDGIAANAVTLTFQ